VGLSCCSRRTSPGAALLALEFLPWRNWQKTLAACAAASRSSRASSSRWRVERYPLMEHHPTGGTMMTRLFRASPRPCSGSSARARAQAWPPKPVKIVVPFAAGGATDVVARLLAQKLTEAWGQSVVVENRAGAGGNIGGDAVAKSPADGYTLLMTSGSIVTANPHMYKSMPYDPAKDLVAITNVATGPQVIAVATNVPVKDLAELIAYAKANPKKRQLRQRRHRHADAPRGGELRALRGRRPHARPVQGESAAHHRPHRRADPARHANLGGAHRLHPAGQDPRARRDQPRAQPAAPDVPAAAEVCRDSRMPGGSASWRRPARRAR
jgi:hypothetical protein